MKKSLTVILLTLIAAQPLLAQRKLLPKFVRKMLFEKDSTKHSSFFLLPVFSSAPETGIELGGSALYSFYTDTLSAGARVSNVLGYATITTKGQTRFSLSTNYWTSQNRYHYTARIDYINFPFNFYGVGNNTHKIDEDKLGQKRLKLNVSAEKRFGNSIYIGLIAGGFRYAYKDKEPGGIFSAYDYNGKDGGSTIFIGPSFTFDNRNNNTYTTTGSMFTASYSVMQGIFSNNDYTGGLLNVELTHFLSVSKKIVLGIDVQSQNLTGAQSPFYLLPALGNDELMRGYYNGRFRDRNLIAGQAEIRYRVSDRIGIVGFGGTGTVYNSSFRPANLKLNYGGGLRYFFDVEKGLSMRADYGIGEKRPGEPRQSGFYLSLGEAF
jgi:hypothetical protein